MNGDLFFIYLISGIFWLAFVMTVCSFMRKQREANRQIIGLLTGMLEELKRLRESKDGYRPPPVAATPSPAMAKESDARKPYVL